MNKIKYLSSLLLLWILLGSQSVKAQGHKIGYTNFNYLYEQMDEKPFIDLVLKSIKSEHDSVMKTKVKVYQEKYSLYQETAKKTNNEVILRDMQLELQTLQKAAQDFQQSSNKAIFEKEQTLSSPIKMKILKAIQEIAKEKGYAYILNSYMEEVNLAVLLQATEDNNITAAVLKKLGIEPQPATPAVPAKK